MTKLVENDIRKLEQRIITYTFDRYYDEFTDLLDEYAFDLDMPQEATEVFTFLIGNWIIFTVPFENGKTAIASFIEEHLDSVTRPVLRKSLSKWDEGAICVSRLQKIKSMYEIEIQPLFHEEGMTVSVFEQGERELVEDSLLIGILVPLGENFTFFTTFIDFRDEEAEEIEDLIVDMFYESDETDFDTYVTRHFPDILETLFLDASYLDDSLEMANELEIDDFEWFSPQYSEVAERFHAEMEKKGVPESYMKAGIALWYAYCKVYQPVIKNPALYIALLHYFVFKKMGLDSSVTQQEVAELYRVSSSNLSKKSREMMDMLEHERYLEALDDEDDDIDFDDIFRPSFLTERKLREVEKKLEGKNFESDQEMIDYMNSIMDDDEDSVDEPLSAKEKAQELLYQAYDSSGKEKMKLVNKALRLYPNSPDAYHILGIDAWNKGMISKAKSLFEKGIEVGKKDLGSNFFKENVGHFWGFVLTRPFMRVKGSYAQLLLETGEIDESIEQFEEMLKLNPSDNQGVRYDLFVAYMKRGSLTKAKALLDEYDEPTANGNYNRLFIELLEHGKTAKAEELFQTANEENPHVLPYLLNQKRIPTREPLAFGLGSEEEAVIYASRHTELWKENQDALKRLKELAKA